MKITGFTDYRTRTKILWLCLMGIFAVTVGASVASALDYPLSHAAGLALAAVVTFLLGRYEMRLPKTLIEISVGHVIAIWGVFWLGVSGGVLLGATASFARLFRGRKVSAAGLFYVFAGTVSIAAATEISSPLFAIDFGFHEGWSEFANFPRLVIGIGSVSLLCFALFTTFDLAYRASESGPGPEYVKGLYIRAAEFLIVAVASLLLCLLFANFGMAFGLVVAPAAILAISAYRIHVQRLDSKTAEILEASRVHLATVEALATAIDARDQIGSGHVRRTEIYAVGIGEAFGLSTDEISALRTGALLHGIGKLAIPDHILNKPGKLTPAELEKTKIHALVGASILDRVGFKYPVVPTVKYHNEFWDGSGYPEGLAGRNIPLTARILSIADSYDTLRSTRPFRPAVSREAAREHLRDMAGSQFDPQIVSVFLKRLTILEAQIHAAGLSYVENGSEECSIMADASGNYIEQIKLANREVFTLYEMAREFGSMTDLDDLLSLLTRKIKDLVPFDTCAVYLLDNSKRYANAVRVDGPNAELLGSRSIKVGEGATGVAMKKQQVVKNVNPDLDFSLSDLELIQQHSTMIAYPLLADGELIGAVSVYSAELSHYGDEHVRLLETISRIAADAIGKSRQHAEAKAHALTDPMTGLPNARSLQLQFEKEAGRADRSGNSLQVLVMDLDGFKAVNDTFGHKVGDEMLRAVGMVIRHQLRDYDFLSRYGGDEFVALIPETGPADVSDLCARIEKAVGEFRLPVGDHIAAAVGISLGAAGYPESGSTFDQMIVSADKAMYSRKFSRKRASNPKNKDAAELMSDVVVGTSPEPPYEFGLLERASNGGLIVELDESHVINSNSIN